MNLIFQILEFLISFLKNFIQHFPKKKVVYSNNSDDINMIQDNFINYWFKPKNYGYGAYPSTKEGWIVILLYLLFLYLIMTYLVQFIFLQIFLLFLLVISLIYISKKKTKETWKWR